MADQSIPENSLNAADYMSEATQQTLENNTTDETTTTSKNPDEKKIFVGGLSWETTEKDLKEYFEKFGEVCECTLKTDQTTGRSRGFGFVCFSSTYSVDKAIAEDHHLHGRKIDPKKAKAKGGKEPIKKIFVGGVDPTTPESEVREHFSKYGKVEEIDLPYDKAKSSRRAFVFVTFESEDVVDLVCKEPKQSIAGKPVDIKKAMPKSEQQNQAAFGATRGGGRGGQATRGGRGGYNNYGGDQVSSWGQGDQNYGYDYYGGGQGYYSYPSQYDYSGAGQYDPSYYPYQYPGYSGGYGAPPSAPPNPQGQASAPGSYKAKRGGGAQPGYHPYTR